MLRNQSSPVSTPRFYYDTDRVGDHISIPPDTKVFLYFFNPPDKPNIAGELRLRVVSSDDPASFEGGSDFLRANGQIWSRSLYVLSKKYTPLYEILKEEKSVSDALDTVLSTLPSIKLRSQPLYTLNDPFIIDFSNYSKNFTVITEQGVEIIRFTEPFWDAHQSCTVLPYTGAYTNDHLSIDDSNESAGSALARFERSTLPDHKGTRTVTLRFLKIITPVSCVIPHYDGDILPPKEGELYRRRKVIGEFDPPVWSIDIDKCPLMRGLHLLWDI